jgi:hypothetical protein
LRIVISTAENTENKIYEPDASGFILFFMEQIHKTITFPRLPLAVYRELAAHLRQVKGVDVELIPQSSSDFDYYQSQIAGLSISYPSDVNEELVQRILDYYRNH